jgi:hypothetical protein
MPRGQTAPVFHGCKPRLVGGSLLSALTGRRPPNVRRRDYRWDIARHGRATSAISSERVSSASDRRGR